MIYKIAYTLKMSYKTDYEIDGFFQYVVPPLEGLWWFEDGKMPNMSYKESFNWISMIRLPEFIAEKDFLWAVETAKNKTPLDYSKIKFFSYNEGLCVQSLHKGSYENEGDTIENLIAYAKENGFEIDEESGRYHHEIYLSDPRKSKPENLKTVIRLPIKEQ